VPPNSLRNSVLDDVGNPDATPGSAAWARWFVLRAKKYRKDLESDATSLRELIEKLSKHEAWKALGLASFSMLCTIEIGLSQEELDRLNAAAPGATVGAVLGAHGGDRRSDEAKDQGTNSTLIRGSTQPYTLARLDRDHPALAERVRAGELTPNAAAIQAGFRTRMLSVPLDPARAARILVKHLQPEQVKALIIALSHAAGFKIEHD
jgi:hypothetical protein